MSPTSTRVCIALLLGSFVNLGLLSSAKASEAIQAGWVFEQIPATLGGTQRETYLVKRMRERISLLEPKGEVSDTRMTEAEGESDLFVASSKTPDRIHYLLYPYRYPRHYGLFGSEVRLCQVSLNLNKYSFLVATDILRNGDCRPDSARSVEYHRWIEQSGKTDAEPSQ
jgi:hypothetical protein